MKITVTCLKKQHGSHLNTSATTKIVPVFLPQSAISNIEGKESRVHAVNLGKAGDLLILMCLCF